MNHIHDFKLRNLNQQDLEQVAKIHTSAFPGSALNQFGRKAIMEYYAWQLKPPNICYAIGVFNDEKLLGFSFSGILRNAELYFFQERFFYFGFKLICHPSLFLDKTIRSKFSVIISAIKDHYKKKKQIDEEKGQTKEIRFGILSTAVDPTFQGHGIGKWLTESVETYARQNKYPSISMSVHSDNEKSILLHEKLGYKKVFMDDGTWQGIMRKDIRESKTEIHKNFQNEEK